MIQGKNANPPLPQNSKNQRNIFMRKIIFSLALFMPLSLFAGDGPSNSGKDKGILLSCEGRGLRVEGFSADITNSNPALGETTLRVWYHGYMINDSAALTREEDSNLVFQTLEQRGSLAGMALGVDRNTLKGEFTAIALDGSTIQRKVTCTRI